MPLKAGDATQSSESMAFDQQTDSAPYNNRHIRHHGSGSWLLSSGRERAPNDNRHRAAAGGKWWQTISVSLANQCGGWSIFLAGGNELQNQQQQPVLHVVCQFLIYTDRVVFFLCSVPSRPLAFCLYTDRMKDCWLSIAHKRLAGACVQIKRVK